MRNRENEAESRERVGQLVERCKRQTEQTKTTALHGQFITWNSILFYPFHCKQMTSSQAQTTRKKTSTESKMDELAFEII